ncbi:MAG: hypothetical protein DYH02_16125 [Candidatus Omnitrophica bacterium COP1]|nr:hypothetical protein [Candidatus Omnitrophica bacterium COP1]
MWIGTRLTDSIEILSILPGVVKSALCFIRASLSMIEIRRMPDRFSGNRLDRSFFSRKDRPLMPPPRYVL